MGGVRFADGALERFAVVEDGQVVAAANLSDFGGRPRDVRVLVAAAARGRGLATLVGAHAASVAVRRDGLARWRAQTANHASPAAADRLGFTRWCTQLAARPPVC